MKFSKTVFYEVNLAAQSSHLEVLILIRFLSKRRDFNFCGLLRKHKLYFYSDCPRPSHDCGTVVCNEKFVMIKYLLRIVFNEKLE